MRRAEDRGRGYIQETSAMSHDEGPWTTTEARLQSGFPRPTDDWATAVARYESAKAALPDPANDDARVAGYVLRRTMLGIALAAKEHDYADAVFAEMEAMAEADGGRVHVPAFCDHTAIDKLMRARAVRHDQAGAFEVLQVIKSCAERFPDDEDAALALTDAYGLMAELYSVLEDTAATRVCLKDALRSYPYESFSDVRLQWLSDLGTTVMRNFLDADDIESAQRIAAILRPLLPDHSLVQFMSDGEVVSYEVDLPMRPDTEDVDQPPSDDPGIVSDTDEELGRILDDYGFDDMVERTFFDCITMMVPRRWVWQCDDDSEMWGLWEEGIESGTFWIDYHIFSVENGADAASRFVKKYSEKIAGICAENPDAIGEPFVQEIDDGYAVLHVYTSRENGHELIHYGCQRLLLHHEHALLVQFTMVLPAELADRPDFVWLRERMAQACLDARVDIDVALIGGPTR
jgi:hypothetical protein